MLIKIVVRENVINVISAYAPHVELDEHIKGQFFDQMDELMQEMPIG